MVAATAEISPELVDLLTELNDLKRIHCAGRTGSLATRLFREAWQALLDGTGVRTVSRQITLRALAAARLGDLDQPFLVASGISALSAAQIQRDAITALVGRLRPVIATLLDAHEGTTHICAKETTTLPFITDLENQPRAGITCPGKPRILLEPPENHAEHSLMVAVYGVVLSSLYDADADIVFLASLAHHFHNAQMPDVGFTGEMLLGEHLQSIMAHHTDTCLGQLPPKLRRTVVDARRILPDAFSAEGRAFHAADVLDRVLQLNQYMRAASLTPQRMLGEMELVHDGPVKGFQDDVLRLAGLL